METTWRVLLLDLPPLLQEIFAHTLSTHLDLELLPSAPPPNVDLRERDTLPDVVITSGRESDATSRSMALLDRWPNAHVLVLTDMGRNAIMFELRPHRTDCGQLSADEAVDVIRTALGHGGRHD